jgi:hypothetical protein
LAKKYNKSRKQKPNYSKKGLQNVQMETSSDLDLESGLKEQKNKSQSLCSESDQSFSPRKS